MEKETAVILMGIPASGKSTFAKTRCAFAVRINLDTLRTRAREQRLLTECISRRQSFVVDNTNPRRADRAGYIRQAKEAGYRVIGYYLSSRISECVTRNAQRTGKACVPDHVIAHIGGIMELPGYDEGFDALYYVSVRDGDFLVEAWDPEA